ncbi:unnamed protein product [Blepharisma stoltei]|uniref:Protein kinase domain-containing protein n=1 Tax=Blepharisma stoltei TaxID=1481888 RepID=A0AAU9JJE6_9CILI|nr:unnamed protein product [Blepharisma stoltei]
MESGKRSRSSCSSTSEARSHSTYNQDAGHFEWQEGQMINDRYKVKGLLGDGTFGRVLEVEDQDGSFKALKVIRAVKRYVEAAKIEVEILHRINRADPTHQSNIVQLYEDFPLGGNYCLVFEKLGRSLFDIIKLNEYKGFRMWQVQEIAEQLFKAIDFMHTLGLTHTDLKPENILLVNDELRFDEEKKINLPVDCTIRVIDFGGATFREDHHSVIINTRQYRAPEVILELGWDTMSDLWSLGCILVELYTGELLFPTHKNFEHLAMLEKVLGHMPAWMGKRCSYSYKKYFDRDYFLNYPERADHETRRNVRHLLCLEELIPSKYREFRHLIYDLLEFNPNRRLRAKDALRHRFFDADYRPKRSE